ncbi:MAG: DUF3127 domain-containing protein [Lachnospiraceae bacterium]|nr:DUF3127 domain-containing protein [Lachnospiraceae bacterium]
MKFKVTIEKVLPEQGGTSKSGKQWRKQSYVGVYDNSNAQYPKKILFDVMGDRIDQLGIHEGGLYDVEIDFDARPWNDRYFLSASCWKATRLDMEQGTTTAQQPTEVNIEEKTEADDLPF